MKKNNIFSGFMLSVLISILLINTAYASDLIYNGDFETVDSNGNPDGWQIEGGGWDFYRDVNSNFYYSGLKSIWLTIVSIWDIESYGVIRSPLINYTRESYMVSIASDGL